MDHGEKEDKIHGLALAKIRKGRDKLNQEKLKWLGFVNKTV